MPLRPTTTLRLLSSRLPRAALPPPRPLYTPSVIPHTTTPLIRHPKQQQQQQLAKMSTSKPPPQKTTRTSTCNCGQVSLSVTGIDKGAVMCHCANCQRASGSAFAYNFRLLNAEIDIVKGEDLVQLYADGDTKSGKILKRHFCGNCVSLIYLPRFLRFSWGFSL